MNIIFLDIDGPMIPARMYCRGDRPFDPERCSFIYDPVAVDMINQLCEKHNAQVVFATAHNENPPETMRHQGLCNRIKHIHEDCQTGYPLHFDSRYDGIQDWLDRHLNEVEQWIVIDDAEVYPQRQVRVDFEIGMTLSNFNRASQLLGGSAFDWRTVNLWDQNVVERKNVSD